MPPKILVEVGLLWVFLGGGGSVDFIFMGTGIILSDTKAIEVAKDNSNMATH